MRCTAGHDHFERPTPLPTGLDGAPVGARFEDEDAAACLRPRLEELTGRTGADLLVSREQHLDPGGVVEGGHRVHRLHDAGLHVEHARSGRPAVGDGERALGQRTEREHRVVMPQDQHLGITPATPVHVRTGRTVDDVGSDTTGALFHQVSERPAPTSPAPRMSSEGDSTSTSRAEVGEEHVEIGHDVTVPARADRHRLNAY